MASWLELNTKLGNGNGKGDEHVNNAGEDELTFCMEMMNMYAFPIALHTAFELGVFNVLAKAGEGAKLSAKDIALQIGTNNPDAPAMLDRLLSLLACHSVLSCTCTCTCTATSPLGLPLKLYSLSRGSKYFVDDPNGLSMGPALAVILDEVFYKSWSEVKGAILEGGSVAFERAHGMNVFEYSSVDSRYNDVFNKGMTCMTTIIMKRILELYHGFEHVTKLVDVGGGYGVNLKIITSKYPHIQGINFDLPHIINHVPAYAGVEYVGGGMFQSVPSGDAIFMKWILHDWSDEDCLKILKNCYKAIPDDGKVIVVDAVVPIMPEATSTAKATMGSDYVMMAQCSGGKERTQQQFIHLAKESGFTRVKFICACAVNWVMEFYK